MKILSTFALAGVLLGSAAFAAAPSTSAGTAAAPATAASSTMSSCKEQAAAQKLKGAERAKFMKGCKAGKR